MAQEQRQMQLCAPLLEAKAAPGYKGYEGHGDLLICKLLSQIGHHVTQFRGRNEPIAVLVENPEGLLDFLLGVSVVDLGTVKSVFSSARPSAYGEHMDNMVCVCRWQAGRRLVDCTA